MDTIRMAIAGMLADHKAQMLAQKMGVNVSTLYKWSEAPTENSPHGEIPLRRAVQLSLVAGDGRLMDAIAAEAGGVFVPGHQLCGGRFDSEKAALRVLKASARLIEEWTNAAIDGRITPAEYMVLCRDAMQLHVAAAAIVGIAKKRAGI